MKMKLFAAAVAALAAGGAYAQSSVTLYGVADAGIEFQNKQPNNAGNVTRMNSGNQSGSRWGLRGVEDLGGGLKGIFVLESGFTIDDGNQGNLGSSKSDGRLFGRAAYVGLQSTYGTLTLGRQQTPFYDFGLVFDPNAIAAKYSITAHDSAFSSRADNSVKYVGTFGGLTATALYSFGSNTGGLTSSATQGTAGEVPGNYKLGKEYSASLTYAAGPFGVGVVYDETNLGIIGTPDARTRRASLAGSYAFGPAKAYAGYRYAHGVNTGGVLSGVLAGNPQTSNLYWLGLGYQLTPAFSLTGTAYYQDFRGTKADPWSFVALADYALSKRTDAYVSMAFAKNKSGSNLGVDGFGKVNGSDNQFGATVGIRHKF